MNRFIAKKRNNYLLILLLILAGLSACDDGRIYPDEEEELTGGKGMMQVIFHGEEAWPQSYMLIFAAFDENGKIPLKSKIISQPPISGSPVEVTLNGLDEQTRRLSIAVVNKGRELIYEFYSCPVENPLQEILLPVGEIDLAVFNRVQQQVFDAYCIRCHGAGEQAAAGLNLTRDYSYKGLVGQPAKLATSQVSLAEPNLPNRSFLVEVLKEDLIRYNHTDVLPEAELIGLIETWIKDGAKN